MNFLKATVVCCVLPCGVLSINLSQARSYFPSRRYLLDANATVIDEIYEEYKAEPSAQLHTTGFLRQDTHDWLRSVWIQAQVLPIGVCFKEGYSGGSAMLSEVLIASDSVFRTTKVFLEDNCTGPSKSVPFVQPRTQTIHQLEQSIQHVSNFEDALSIPPAGTSGMIVSSYYSSEGCAGNVAQYDLVSERCSVYGYPVGAMGAFQCDAQAQSMLLTLYGPFDADSYTYPICTVQDADDAQYGYNMFYAYYEDGAQVYKQPLSCYEESSVDSEETDTPYFQTIKCIPGTSPASDPALEDPYYDPYYTA